MLITETYKALQADLHARYDYGRGVSAEECSIIVRNLIDPPATVLDYGCGQGHLGRLLDGYEIEDYDPCIEGKDDEPARADVVVCADVLEHIEPDLLDNVLLHLRCLVRKYLVLVVATQPSNKIMADGRQAHLIVEGNGFWFQKLTGLFHFERFEDRTHEGRGLLIVATPREFKSEALLPIARVRGTSAVDDESRNENVRRNCASEKRRLDLEISAHDRTAHLACYGPSLTRTWPALALARAHGHEIFTVSGAHKFLIERGVIPTAHMDCDPRPHKALMLGEPHADVAYWIASCVDPSYLEKLAGMDVSLWHSYNGKDSFKAFDKGNKERMVVGGGSIGLRALSLLYVRGYRTFEIHAMDCCHENGEHHGGPHLGRHYSGVPVKVHNRWFEANAVMLLYTQYFKKQARMMADATFRFHGDGLLKHMIEGE